MGLFDALKGEAQRNFIARSDTAKNDIIYAYPERNVRMMTQLTVGADEVAVFVKDGQVQGKLGAGRSRGRGVSAAASFICGPNAARRAALSAVSA